MVQGFIKVGDYNKITDVVMHVTNNCLLKFSVLLNKKDKRTNNLDNFHKEYKYYSRTNHKDQYTISRDFEYYLSLDNIYPDENGYKESIIIGICEITMMQFLINAAVDWFSKPEFSNMYANKDGKLVIVQSVSPKKAIFRTKYIEIEPIVYIDTSNVYDLGVRMYLNSETNYVEMPLSRLLGLQYIINRFDLYQAAVALINYIERPELGTNLVNFSDSRECTMEEKIESSIPNTNMRNGRKISIFEKKQTLGDSLG